MPYAVSTPVFEGPFDLLLHLITRDQVDLYEISLSAIVDAYLVELEKLEALDLEVATEFLLIAATLIELKLRRLLPDREGIDLDEELALLEERDLLLAKLLEYRTFKEAAKEIDRRMTAAAKSAPRPGGLEDALVDLTPDVLSGVTPERLRSVFLNAVQRFLTPKPEPRVMLDHITAVRVTVAETVGELAQSLPGRGRVSFRDLTEDLETRMDVIVHFLAVLELCKQGWVDLDQSRSFGDLLVSWRPGGPDLDDLDATDASVLARSFDSGPAHDSHAPDLIDLIDLDDLTDLTDLHDLDDLHDEADLLVVSAGARPQVVLAEVDDYEG